jgi:hypothetical protein
MEVFKESQQTGDAGDKLLHFHPTSKAGKSGESKVWLQFDGCKFETQGESHQSISSEDRKKLKIFQTPLSYFKGHQGEEFSLYLVKRGRLDQFELLQ